MAPQKPPPQQQLQAWLNKGFRLLDRLSEAEQLQILAELLARYPSAAPPPDMARPSNDFIFGGFGAAKFPAEASDVEGDQFFTALDPVLATMLALFTAAINQELGHSTTSVVSTSWWSVARVGTPLAAALPVADTLWIAPSPNVLLSSKYSFPLLALYREQGVVDEWTLTRERDTCTWGMDYILGPLNPADLRRLAASMTHARQTVQMVIRKRGHPAYEGGALQFGDGLPSALYDLALTEWQVGEAKFGEEGGKGQVFHMVSMTLKTEEMAIPDSAAVAVPFEGASITVGLGGDGGVLPGVGEMRTEVPQQAPFGKPPNSG